MRGERLFPELLLPCVLLAMSPARRWVVFDTRAEPLFDFASGEQEISCY